MLNLIQRPPVELDMNPDALHADYRAFAASHQTPIETYADSPAFAMRRKLFNARTGREHTLLERHVDVKTVTLADGVGGYHVYLGDTLYGQAVYEEPTIVITTPLGVLCIDLSNDTHIQNISGRIADAVRENVRTYVDNSINLSNHEIARDLERFAAFKERHSVQLRTQRHCDALRDVLQGKPLDLPYKARHITCHDHRIVARRFGREQHIGVYGDVGTSVVVYSQYGDFTLPIDAEKDFTAQVASGLLAQHAELEAIRRRFTKRTPGEATFKDFHDIAYLHISLRVHKAFTALLALDPLYFKDDVLHFASLSSVVSCIMKETNTDTRDAVEMRYDIPSTYTHANGYGVADLNWSDLHQSGRLTVDPCGAWLLDNTRIGQTVASTGDIPILDDPRHHWARDYRFEYLYFIHPFGRLLLKGETVTHTQRLRDWCAHLADAEQRAYVEATTRLSADLHQALRPSEYLSLQASIRKHFRVLHELNHVRNRLRF